MAEYPAYGARDGELCEVALVADAAETLALARRQFPGPLLLASESLGAGVAAAVANTANVAAVLLITPWDGIELNRIASLGSQAWAIVSGLLVAGTDQDEAAHRGGTGLGRYAGIQAIARYLQLRTVLEVAAGRQDPAPRY